MENVCFEIVNQFFFAPELCGALADIEQAFFQSGCIADNLPMKTEADTHKALSIGN